MEHNTFLIFIFYKRIDRTVGQRSTNWHESYVNGIMILVTVGFRGGVGLLSVDIKKHCNYNIDHNWQSQISFYSNTLLYMGFTKKATLVYKTLSFFLVSVWTDQASAYKLQNRWFAYWWSGVYSKYEAIAHRWGRSWKIG